jgi:hypothetical protein
LTQKEVGKAVGLTEVTLRKVVKELGPSWPQLIPPAFVPLSVPGQLVKLQHDIDDDDSTSPAPQTSNSALTSLATLASVSAVPSTSSSSSSSSSNSTQFVSISIPLPTLPTDHPEPLSPIIRPVLVRPSSVSTMVGETDPELNDWQSSMLRGNSSTNFGTRTQSSLSNTGGLQRRSSSVISFPSQRALSFSSASSSALANTSVSTSSATVTKSMNTSAPPQAFQFLTKLHTMAQNLAQSNTIDFPPLTDPKLGLIPEGNRLYISNSNIINTNSSKFLLPHGMCTGPGFFFLLVLIVFVSVSCRL